jgi:cholesterol transport system auxiliary component
MRQAHLALIAVAAASGALAGCVSLFPKAPPAQLYRFEASVAAAQQPAGATVTVRESPIDFLAGSGGDGIMTVRGEEVAYIEGARWDIPAEKQFAAAVSESFAAAGGPVRLVEPGTPSQALDRLTLQVTAFEADYGPSGPPQVRISVHAVLTRESDLSFVGERTFDVSVPADQDRVSAIVGAFNDAVTKEVGDLTSWVEDTAGRQRG